jgi:hypothetical protein
MYLELFLGFAGPVESSILIFFVLQDFLENVGI